MKLNRKGFAITAVLYGILILFVLLVGSYLIVLSARKNRVDRIIEDMEYTYKYGYTASSSIPDGSGDTGGADTGDTGGADTGDTGGAGTGDTGGAGTGDTGTDSDDKLTVWIIRKLKVNDGSLVEGYWEKLEVASGESIENHLVIPYVNDPVNDVPYMEICKWMYDEDDTTCDDGKSFESSRIGSVRGFDGVKISIDNVTSNTTCTIYFTSEVDDCPYQSSNNGRE